MALYVPGMNCKLCSYKIDELDAIIMFPSFIENKADPIYFVNYAVFHLNCFNKHNYAERALMLLNEYTAKLSPKRCECFCASKLARNCSSCLSQNCLV